MNLFAQIPTKDLSLWLRADKTVLASDGKVSGWQDQSGNNYNATTTSVNPPLLVLNELNGHPVIRFNGLDNSMQTVPFQTFPAKRGTVIVVLKVKGPGSTSGVGYGTFVSTYFNKGITWQLGAKGPVSIYYDGVGSSGFPVAEMIVGRWALVTLLRESDSIMHFQRDDIIDLPFRISNNQPDTNSLQIASNGRLEVLNGDIAEIIIYGTSLNAPDLKLVHSYLNKKYQLTTHWPEPKKPGIWPYMLLLLLAFIVAIVVTKYLAQRKLKKKLIELERQQEMDKERQRISREMHDDIGAGLTQITLMSESAKNKNSADNSKELDDIASTSRKLVSNMSEIIWSLNPENKTLEHLLAYLREQLHKLLEYSGISYSIGFPETGNDILLTNEQRRNILLVTKEIINNAVKHSKAQNIIVKATLQNNKLDVEVQDDGIGFDIRTTRTGNGQKNIRHRIEEMGGILEIESAPGKGSRFVYRISFGATT